MSPSSPLLNILPLNPSNASKRDSHAWPDLSGSSVAGVCPSCRMATCLVRRAFVFFAFLNLVFNSLVAAAVMDSTARWPYCFFNSTQRSCIGLYRSLSWFTKDSTVSNSCSIIILLLLILLVMTYGKFTGEDIKLFKGE